MTRRLAIWLILLIAFVGLVMSAADAGGGASAATASLQRSGVSYDGARVQDGDADARVAMIPIYNVLTDGDSAADGTSTGGDDIVRMIDAIVEDADAWDGVILELDTPGGSVLASEEVTAALDRLNDDTDLPVLAWMRGTAASAGYYIAASADRIVASKNTFTGSIGVILEYTVVDELAKTVGVEQVTIKSGKLKDIGSPFRKITPQERALFQRIIDEAYDGFVEVVARGRSMPKDEVRELADGRIYTGSQAASLGLVDELGLQRTAFDAMSKLIDKDSKPKSGDRLDVVRFTRTFGFLESLSATAQPTIDSLAAARAVGALLTGSGSSGASPAASAAVNASRPGNGFARLEYRAVIG